MSISTIIEFQQAELKKSIKTQISQLTQKFETQLLSCNDLDQFEDLDVALGNLLVLWNKSGNENIMWLFECLAKSDYWAAMKELNFLAKEHTQLDLLTEIVKATKVSEKDSVTGAIKTITGKK